MMGLTVHRMGIGPAVTAVPGALDDYTSDLWACWSSRPLLSSYTGALIRVRRSSDSTEQDIGQSGGALDTAALSSFVGAGNGTVVKYYDQSGNGRDGLALTGAVDIVVSGITQTLSGIPCGEFPATNGGFYVLQKPSAITVFASVRTTDTVAVMASPGANTAEFLGAWQAGNGGATGGGSGTVAAYVNGTSYATRTDFNAAVSVDAPVILTCTGSSLTAWATAVRVLGYAGLFHYSDKCLDMVIYSSAALADRAAIETALGAAI